MNDDELVDLPWGSPHWDDEHRELHRVPRGELIGWGFAKIDNRSLDFRLVYDGSAAHEKLGLNVADPGEVRTIRDEDDLVRAQTERGLAVDEATRTFVTGVEPNVQVRVPFEKGLPNTAGGGFLQGESLQFLLGTDPIGRVADLIEIAGAGWFLVHKALEALTEKPVAVSDGFAVVLATRAIAETFGTRATELIDVTELHPGDPNGLTEPEGYSLVLRDEEWVYLAIIGVFGDVLSLSRVALEGLGRRRPDRQGTGKRSAAGKDRKKG